MIPLAATGFQIFSPQHVALLVLTAVGIGAAVALGRAHRDTAAEVVVRRRAAVVLGAAALVMQAYQLTPGDFSLRTSLPLHLSDLATFSAVLALWTRDWRATAFTYYIGLTFTVQAVITPSLAETFPHPRFFGFWILHIGVVWAAAYLTWGLGIRPTWRGLRFTVAATVLWAVLTFAFNTAADTNYGYLNRKPSASLLDLMGPWPWYILVAGTIVVSVWALLLTLPWYAGRSRRGAEPPVGAGSR